MKKILLLLLLATFSIQAQTLQNPTYGNVKLKNNTTDNSATKVNVQSTDGTINTISKSDLVNVVEVNDVPSLPLVGEVGKIYVVKNVNKIYRWNGTFYQELAGSDITYQSVIDALTFTPENVANKHNSLAVDGTGTKYPTVDAVNTIGLQKAYNVSPLITTTTPLGAITLRRGSAADTDNILVGQNGAGTNTTSITGNGLITSSGYLTGGTVDVTTSGSIGGNYNIYDDFNRVDSALGVLGTSTSGHVWEHIVNFAGSPVNRTKIQGGMWVNSPGEIGYLPFHTPTPLKSLGAVFSWVSAGGATSNTVMNFSISATGYKSLERLFHVNISVGQLSVGLYTNTPTSEEILLAVPLSLSYNTEYKLEYSINGTNAVITLNGTNYFISNPKIAEFTNARNGFFEFFSNNVDAIDTGRFHKIWTSCESQPTMGNNYNNALSATTLSTTSTTGDNIFKGSFSAGNNASFLVDKFASANTLNINSSSNVGIRTAAATHSLTLGSGATGMSAYNTVDQTTNTEYFHQTWSGASNIYLMGTRYSGTGSPRALRIGASNTVGFTIDRYMEVGGSLGIFNFRAPNTGFTPFINLEANIGSSSALQNILQISPTIQQTGTAGYRGLFIAPFESTVGSGIKNLIDAGTKTAANSAGTYTSKFSVDSAGLTTTVGLNISGQTASTVAILDASKNIVSASTATYPSLTELSYLKGVTSAVQTQINAKANINSPSLTGIPTAPTATVGTNTTQIATTAFVTDADAGNVKLTGNQTISGQKSFSLTGKIDMKTNNVFPAISVTALGSNGGSAAEFINNSSFPYSNALRLYTSSSGGVGNRTLDVLNTSPIGTGIVSEASNGGVSISSQSGNGDSYVSNIASGGTGRNYVGRNNGIETYSVDKTGNVIGNSYIKRSTPINNILLAGGGDIAQNTAFNKNFGTTVGTVVEGGTLGSNAYTSTAYLPLSGGTVNGSVLFNSTTGGAISFQTNSLPLALMTSSQNILGTGSATDFNTYVYGNNPYNIWTDGVKRVTVDGSGNVDFTGTVTASPATASNHLVTKAQLDASATSRPYKVYTALLSQSGTNAPVATVLENTLGGTVVWTRNSTGLYTGTLAGVFTVDKTLTLMNTGYTVNGFEGINRVNVNSVQIQTYLNGPTYSDGRLANSGASIEIRVYN